MKLHKSNIFLLQCPPTNSTAPNPMSCESIQGRFISWHATSAIASSYALLPTEHLVGRHLRPPLLSLPPMFRPRKKSAHHVPLERTHRKAWLPCWGAKAAAEVAQRAARARESLTMVGVGCSLSTKEECVRLRSAAPPPPDARQKYRTGCRPRHRLLSRGPWKK